MNERAKDYMERQVRASLEMMKWLKQGMPLDKQWEELGKMGFTEKERVGVAKCLNAFMKHRTGNHEDCPPTCGNTEIMSKMHDKYSTAKIGDIRGMIDEVDKLHEMNDNKQFSDDVLEEWK